MSSLPTAKVGIQFDLRETTPDEITEYLTPLRQKWKSGRVCDFSLPRIINFWFTIPFGRVVEFEREAVNGTLPCRVVRK